MQVFTGFPGKFVSLEDCITGFTDILKGAYDDIPEQGRCRRYLSGKEMNLKGKVSRVM